MFAPFVISYLFVCLSHVNVSDPQTNVNVRQRWHNKQFLNEGVYN